MIMLTLHETIYNEIEYFQNELVWNVMDKERGEDLPSRFDTFYNGMYKMLRNTYNYDATKYEDDPKKYAEGKLLFDALLLAKKNMDNYQLYLENMDGKTKFEKILLFNDGQHFDLIAKITYDELKELHEQGNIEKAVSYTDPVGYIDVTIDDPAKSLTGNIETRETLDTRAFVNKPLSELGEILEKSEIEKAKRGW
ncbi:hypothetical protein HCA69_15980 [Listeria grandensis]|uniref:Uncharacterized protein n=1 Tax=Listeria grandensis TaxID=1494963 RepID=A0A7X0Y6W9_9LIST|nr:hypothetical protein [Listeria grandensis]MBC1937863.1 hypothetical protein [Listeria grandensis]